MIIITSENEFIKSDSNATCIYSKYFKRKRKWPKSDYFKGHKIFSCFGSFCTKYTSAPTHNVFNVYICFGVVNIEITIVLKI